MSRSPRRWVPAGLVVSVALLAPLLAGCGGDDSGDVSDDASPATSPSTDAAITTSSQTTEESSGQGANTGWMATVEFNGKPLEFSGSACLGPADNFAFIGYTGDSTGSFEIQATAETAQRRMRLVVDESYLGGNISAIEVADWHATGSAALDDGTKVTFEVTCAQ